MRNYSSAERGAVIDSEEIERATKEWLNKGNSITVIEDNSKDTSPYATVSSGDDTSKRIRNNFEDRHVQKLSRQWGDEEAEKKKLDAKIDARIKERVFSKRIKKSKLGVTK